MKTIQLNLPDQLATELEKVVASGWFENTDEALREALRVFLSTRRFVLLEQQQLADIEWALATKAEQP